MPDRPAQGDSFSVYYGEFLVSPVPMELSLNWCSHACGYCFSNLNKPGRWADVKATLNLIRDHESRKTLEAHLLRERYPTLISNKVDPFAVSNDEQAIPIMELMTELEMPIAIQTRGGRNVNAALDFLPPSCWYVSVPMLDDSIRKRVEPAAPAIGERLDLIQRLTEAGHKVSLAVNPLSQEFLPDATELLETAYARGARGVWMEQPHLSMRQLERITPRKRQALGSSFISEARRKLPAVYDAHLMDARETAKEIGYSIFTGGQYERSDYFAPYESTYPLHFPTMQSFVNHCHDTLSAGDLVSFADFRDFFVPHLPSGQWPVYNYLAATTKDVLKYRRGGRPMATRATYADLLERCWTEPKTAVCPARLLCFAYAADWDGDGWIGLTDDDGWPLMVFDPEGGLDKYFVQFDG